MESLRGLISSPASAYDELVTGQKLIRYHWQGILSVIRSLPGGGGASVRIRAAGKVRTDRGEVATDTTELRASDGTCRHAFRKGVIDGAEPASDPLHLRVGPRPGLLTRARLGPSQRIKKIGGSPRSSDDRPHDPPVYVRQPEVAPAEPESQPFVVEAE